MWNLGCLVAELFLGWSLYPGTSEYDQIRYISKCLPAVHMLNKASKPAKFFYRDRDTSYPFWRIKTLKSMRAKQKLKATRRGSTFLTVSRIWDKSTFRQIWSEASYWQRKWTGESSLIC